MKRGDDDDYRYEVIFLTNDPLGIVFAKKKALGAPTGGHLIVKTLKPNKAAATKGVISIGDVVERVNGQKMAPDDVVKVMRSKKRPLRMMLRTRFKPRTRGSADALREANNMVFPSLITPLSASGDVDVASAERLIDALYDTHGVGGLYVCGATGEGMYLSMAARRTITEVAVRKSAEGGRNGKVIVHVGATQSSMAFDLATHAQVSSSMLSYAYLPILTLRWPLTSRRMPRAAVRTPCRPSHPSSVGPESIRTQRCATTTASSA